MSTNILTKQNKQNPEFIQKSFQEIVQQIKANRTTQRNQIKAMKNCYNRIENPQDVICIDEEKQKNLDSKVVSVYKQYNTKLFNEQEDKPILNSKQRSSVNGRDFLKINSKPKFLSSNKQAIRTARLSNNKDKLQNQSPEKIQKKYLLLNQSTILPKLNNNTNQAPSFDNSLHDLVTASQILNGKQKQKRLNFKQKKLNSMLAKSVRIVDINEEKLQSILISQSIDENAQAKQIFGFFSELCDRVGAFLEFPLIKKYRNCVYFGQPIIHNSKYEGFLYYFDRKFYYGQFQNGQRNGQGTEINLINNTITKGVFKEGIKTGYFEVKKYEQKYIGFLENGVYHGKGKLTTKDSIYQGQFRNGLKNGPGMQFFFKNGVTLQGKFIDGYFDPKSLAEGVSNNDNKNLRYRKQIDIANFPNAAWKQAFSRSIEYQKKAHLKKYNLNQSEPTSFNKLNDKPYSSQNNFYPKVKINEVNRNIDYNQSRLQDPQRNFQPRYSMEDLYAFDYSVERMGNQYSNNLPKIEERVETNQLEDPLPAPQFKNK